MSRQAPGSNSTKEIPDQPGEHTYRGMSRLTRPPALGVVCPFPLDAHAIGLRQTLLADRTAAAAAEKRNAAILRVK